ncbi:MAG TPA: type I phosphomannose isomerase catalytic subunit [Terriglobales bacterium]|nr:type I phosphomannose isomerase catalytic subunit [Terriglobales bacterium]
MAPYFSERVWGTRDLSPYFTAPGTEPIGEVWLTGDDCKVIDGPLAGSSLAELSYRFQRQLVGESAPEPNRFPLLTKFLFPHQKLSVQVHPDDEAARCIGQPWGKTECWYVLHAVAGAQIGLGLKPGTTKAEFERAIHETRAEELLNWVDLEAGDMIFVDAGTVHTIGPGSVLVETQQSSDTTFRLYDFGRPRELHVKQGLDAMKELTRAGKVAPEVQDEFNTLLISNPYFRVNKYHLRGGQGQLLRASQQEARDRSVEIIVGLQGAGMLDARGHTPVLFGGGEAVVIPAAIEEFMVRGQREVEFLTMTVPPKTEFSAAQQSPRD